MGDRPLLLFLDRGRSPFWNKSKSAIALNSFSQQRSIALFAANVFAVKGDQLSQ
jgi:hypothetical protein